MTVPPAVDEAAEEADAETEPEEFVCGPCQRRKHRLCRTPECRCCEGNPEDWT